MQDVYHIIDIQGQLLRRFFGECPKGDSPAWQLGLDSFIRDFLLENILTNGVAPRQVIAVWDSGNDYRLGISEKYKEKRRAVSEAKTPEEKAQTKLLFERAKTFLAYIGVKNVSAAGCEADDLIALLAEKLPGVRFIYTGDEDLVVLSALPGVYVRRNGELFDANSTFDGLPAKYISLKKSLVGDSSDGYVGVKGFGPKMFETLVAELGLPWLDWLMAVIDTDNAEAMASVKEQHAVLGKLYNQWAEWRVSWRLAKLAPESCYGVHRGKPRRPEWYVRIPNRSRIKQLFSEIAEYTAPEQLREAEIEKSLQPFERFFPTERLIEAHEYADLQGIMQEIAASPVCSYDYETSDKKQHPNYRLNDRHYVDVLSQELAGISLNWGDNLQHTIYIPFDHKDTGNFPREWATWILSSLDQLEQRPVVQNAAFELAVSYTNLGFMPKAPYDTRILRSYENENEEAGLKEMSRSVLNYRQASYAETTQGRSMHELTGKEVLSYGADDSLVTSHLFDVFRLTMRLEGSWDFYVQNEVDPAVDDAYSFIAGTRLDLPRLEQLRDESALRATAAEAAIRKALEDNLDPSDTDRITQGATTLLKEYWETAKYKYLDKPEDANAAYQALWEKAWASCSYTPLVRTEESAEFLPTLGNINKVLGLIASDAPKLPKLTVRSIEEFDNDIQAFSGQLRKDDPREPILREFMTLLYSARKVLAPTKRTGDQYENFRGFCQEVFDEMLPKKVKSSGTDLNFGSGPQMQSFLYGMLALPIRRRSKPTEGSLREKERLPGSPATGLKAVAAAIVKDVPDESDWRHITLKDYGILCKERQVESLYFNKYPHWVRPETGRLHPQFRNCGTVTRRPAGNSPNLLQVSKGSMRTVFPAGDGRVFVSMDLSNQEIVVLAAESRDPVMLESFLSTPRRDIHSVTSLSYAHTLLTRRGLNTPNQLTYDEFLAGLHSQDKEIAAHYSFVRNKISKGVNFLLAYLGGYTTLAENLLISEDLAKDLMNQTFRLYSRVQPWQQETIEFAKTHGHTEMAYGSRRHVTPDIYSRDDGTRKRMERQAVNAVIQGSSAEILKRIRSEIFRRKMRERYQMESIFQIYDEVTASVPVEAVEEYTMELAEVMRVTPPGYPVGMEVEASIGYTWGSQIEVGIPTNEKIKAALEQLKEND